MSDFCCRDIIECMVNAFSRSPNFTSKRMSDDAIELGVNRGYNRDEVEARYIKDMGEGPRESFSLEEAKKDIDELSSENIKNAYKLNYYEMIKEGNSNYYMISKKTPNEGDYASQNTGFKIHVSLAHKNEKDISGDNVDKA